MDDAMLANIHIPGAPEAHRTPMREARTRDGITAPAINAGDSTRHPYKKATAVQDARIDKLEGEFEKMRKELAITKEHTTTIDNNTRILLTQFEKAEKKTDALMVHVDTIGKGFVMF
jgi:hypothetical protein